MKRVLQIVDDVNYVRTNCYQSQLLKTLQRNCDNFTCPVAALTADWLNWYERSYGKFDTIVSTLKIRTLDRLRNEVASCLCDRALVVYDQDAFECCRDDGPHFGAHERIVSALNVSKFVVTTRKYADHMNTKGLKTDFQHIWMLPELCRVAKPWNERSIDVAFMGSMHPWRRRLIDSLEVRGVHVQVGTNSKSYAEYLDDLQDVKVFVCSHDSQMLMDGVRQTTRHGMFHKDVEIMSQGCFSISDQSDERWSYVDDTMSTLICYDRVDDVPELIDGVNSLDVIERQDLIDRTVDSIRAQDRWSRTATSLIAG